MKAYEIKAAPSHYDVLDIGPTSMLVIDEMLLTSLSTF